VKKERKKKEPEKERESEVWCVSEEKKRGKETQTEQSMHI
jgi:hypothetical protein